VSNVYRKLSIPPWQPASRLPHCTELMKSTVLPRFFVRDHLPPTAEGGSRQQLSAVIDGVKWMAGESVLVTLQSGLLGVAGFDGAGRGVAIALMVDRIGERQVVGSSPANAIVTVAGRTWAANGAGGAGGLLLVSLKLERAVGQFSFTAAPTVGTEELAMKRVLKGHFDIAL
jgi:hypothetical protein